MRCLFLSFFYFANSFLLAQGWIPYSQILSKGFAKIPLYQSQNPERYLVHKSDEQKLIADFCVNLIFHYQRNNLGNNPCGKNSNSLWHAEYKSSAGHPLLYAEFGSGEEVTLLMSGVHPDEITPIPMGFKLVDYLTQNPDAFDHQKYRIVIMPLINPDGFMRSIPTRTNSNGIDLNRNFLTEDWYASAKTWWQTMAKRNPKKFPGYLPNSEIETIFQIDMIDRFRPRKIISLHAPLGFLDYDGPGDQKSALHVQSKPLNSSFEDTKKIVQVISKSTANYRIVDYAFYPGSVGNFAGFERNIPTVTLELETTDAKKVELYWQRILPGIIKTISYPIHTPGFYQQTSDGSFVAKKIRSEIKGG